MRSTPSPSPLDALPGYRAVRGLRTRGLAREVLAVREGPAAFRRFCSLRLALADDVRCAHALTREAAILSRLHHPSILPAHDFLYSQGWLALVLAFDGAFTVDSVAAATGVPGEPIETEAAMFVAHVVFDGLAHAHGKRDRDGRPLIHGDLHPANILIRSTGHVWIRGFRGAECLLPPRIETRTRTEPGPYAAPELLSGAPASTASDIFGAAALVWHLLVGRPPRHGEIPSLSRACPGLFPEVVAVLDVCLSPNPDDRRLRAGTVAATLGKVVDIHAGRDCLERRYDIVLRTLPPKIRDFCAGSLPGHSSQAWSVPPDRLPRVRRDSASIPAVGITSLPPPAYDTDESQDSGSPPSASATATLPEKHESTSEAQTHDGHFPPDSDPSDRLIGLASLAKSLSIAPPSSARSLPARSSPPPHSLAPVGRDVEHRSPRAASAWQIAAVLTALALFPVGWIAGRTVVAAAKPWLDGAPSTQSPLPPLPTQARTPPPMEPASSLSAQIDASAPPPPAPPASSSPVSFNQSSLTVEAPPHGIVFLNGKPVGRTGERLTTRGCGLRFVRVAQPPEERGEQGFRWLSKGQTVNLPCGGALTVRPPEHEAPPNDATTSERD
jgi:serine/threonine protein kinase